jgi:hypothetical protein
MLACDEQKFAFGAVFRLAAQLSQEVKLAFENLLNGPKPRPPQSFVQLRLNQRQFEPSIPRLVTVRLLYYNYAGMQSDLDTMHTHNPLEYCAIKEAAKSWEETYHFLGTSLLRKCWTSLQAVLHHHDDQPLEVLHQFTENPSFSPHTIQGVNTRLNHRYKEIWPSSSFERDFIVQLRDADAILASLIRTEAPIQGPDKEERDLLDDCLRHQKVLALANILAGPIIKDFTRLVLGWQPDPVWHPTWFQAPGGAPSLPATPNHNHSDESLHDFAASTNLPIIRNIPVDGGIGLSPLSKVSSNPDGKSSQQSNASSAREASDQAAFTSSFNADPKKRHETDLEKPAIRRIDSDRKRDVLLRFYTGNPHKSLISKNTDPDQTIYRAASVCSTFDEQDQVLVGANSIDPIVRRLKVDPVPTSNSRGSPPITVIRRSYTDAIPTQRSLEPLTNAVIRRKLIDTIPTTTPTGSLPSTVLRRIDTGRVTLGNEDRTSAVARPTETGKPSAGNMSTQWTPLARPTHLAEARQNSGENNLRKLRRSNPAPNEEWHKTTVESPKPGQGTWQPSHGIAFQPTRRLSAPSALASVEEDSNSDAEVASIDPDETDDCYQPLDFQIPEDKWTEAQQAAAGSRASYWSYDKYRSSTGEPVLLQYCRSKETSEKVAQSFVNEAVIGCDIEWKSSAKETDGFKNNVSLIQVACENRVALFHIALHKGTTVEEVLAPTLKRVLESPDVLKCGVSIKGDFSRMSKHLGIDIVSIFELSHLHRLVEYGVTNRKWVNRKLVKLSEQAEKHLGLPLYKGEERVSDWSQSLNMEQCKYAADDAYASYRIFEALKEKWYQLEPRPPFPASAELGLPIQLAPLPESDTSDSEGGESEAAEVAELVEKLKDAAIEGATKVDSSEDDFGKNVFDELTEEQLRQLEKWPKQKSHTEGQRVIYPTLTSELAIPESRGVYIGRIGLQPRMRDMSILRHRRGSTGPAPVPLTTSSESDLEAEEEEIEESKPDLQAISNTNKDLYVEAAQWAEETLKRPQEASSNFKITATPAALRAYYFWEHKKMDVTEIAALLREKPLKPATVASYVSECLQFSNMKFSDRGRLQALVKQLPRQARERYWRIRKMAEEDG